MSVFSSLNAMIRSSPAYLTREKKLEGHSPGMWIAELQTLVRILLQCKNDRTTGP